MAGRLAYKESAEGAAVGQSSVSVLETSSCLFSSCNWTTWIGIRWFPCNVGSTLTSGFESQWPSKSKTDFLVALLGFRKSDLGKCRMFVWNGGKHLCTSCCIHGSGLESSKQQKALYSCEFCWFYKGSTQIIDLSSFVSTKKCLLFPGKSRHYMQIDKNVSKRLHGSHTRTVTNCQAFITKCDTQSRHIRPWNLKKTKSSKHSKLKENFIHIGCFAFQTMVEN